MSAHRVLLSGPDRAAALLLALGLDRSREVLSYLGREEVALISERLAHLPHLDAAARGGLLAEFLRSVSEPPPTEPEAEPPARADREAVVALDPMRLERLPRARAKRSALPSRGAFEALGDLSIGCRAQLAPVRLPLTSLVGLEIGDVILLGPAAEVDAELVGGRGCRLRGRVRERGGRRALEIVESAPGDAGGER